MFEPITKESVFSKIPHRKNEVDSKGIRTRIRAVERKVIAIDDDPTGTQTVHGIPVLSEWSVEVLKRELSSDYPGFYVMTNSRAMPESEAAWVNREIGENLKVAAEGKRIAIVSRSDSTLRGHFPAETRALAEGLGTEFDATFIAPAFFEGGRFTIDDVHYVLEGEMLIPAGLTEFARDRSFGYKSSDLKQWVDEKTGGKIQAADVFSLSLEDLRNDADGALVEKILALPRGCVCVVNAVSYDDFDVLADSIRIAEEKGRRYLFRAAGAVVRSLAGIVPKPVLNPSEVVDVEGRGGLIVVGSYIQKSTRQLEALLKVEGMAALEVSVAAILSPESCQAEVARVIEAMNEFLSEGKDVVVYTSRSTAADRSRAGDLNVGKTVSDALVEIVQGIAEKPRYFIAKGGITSSETATKGLGMRRAMILGQMIPGVPVWRMGEESRFPGMAYVVFPGNVGSDDSIASAVGAFRSINRERTL